MSPNEMGTRDLLSETRSRSSDKSVDTLDIRSFEDWKQIAGVLRAGRCRSSDRQQGAGTGQLKMPRSGHQA